MSKSLTLAQIQNLQLVRAIACAIQQPASAADPMATPLYDEEPSFNNQDLVILTSGVRAASANGVDRTNHNARGLILVIDVTAVPGTDTVTFTIQGKDPASGKYYTVLASAALVATGTVVLRVGPGLTAANNLVANDILPRTWRVITTHSAATNFTYSVGGILVL
jgi:hypothetical protein